MTKEQASQISKNIKKIIKEKKISKSTLVMKTRLVEGETSQQLQKIRCGMMVMDDVCL